MIYLLWHGQKNNEPKAIVATKAEVNPKILPIYSCGRWMFADTMALETRATKPANFRLACGGPLDTLY
jgi:hypothetical protein